MYMGYLLPYVFFFNVILFLIRCTCKIQEFQIFKTLLLSQLLGIVNQTFYTVLMVIPLKVFFLNFSNCKLKFQLLKS